MTTERTPRLQPGLLPSLCALGPRLLTMTKLFRVWMIYHFSADNLENLQLERLLWQPDQQATGVVIEANTAYDPQKTEYRPAVIIKRQSWRRVRVGIGNRYMGEMSRDGIMHHANLWQGAHTIFCLAGEDGEAELLATEVFRELNEHADVVQQLLGLHRLEVAEVGEVSILEEASQHFVVPINIGYAVMESWRVRQEAPFFKRLDLSILGL
jgi:hypothetical protein